MMPDPARIGERRAADMDATVAYREPMDQAEFTRRIKVYLDLDFPKLNDTGALADRLGQRLFEYLRQERLQPAGESETLLSLLPKGRVLFWFFARWDASASGYREIIERVSADLHATVIEIDVDDPIGGAIACAHGIANVPAVVDARSSGSPVVGARTAEDLRAALTKP
jgi:hypothetical protein